MLSRQRQMKLESLKERFPQYAPDMKAALEEGVLLEQTVDSRPAGDSQGADGIPARR